MKPQITARLLPAAGLALAALSGCTATDAARPAVAAPAAPVALPKLGLEAVMGQDAAALERSFGPANADVREGTARKLQFTSAICILDAYLYPAKEGAEPQVTWLDARQRDGSAIDRASCVAALTRRTGGK